MDTLWAPWRIAYVQNSRSEACIFCAIPPPEQREEDYLILFRGKSVFVRMNLYPYNPGHLMIAPYRHLNDLAKFSVGEQLELVQVAARSTTILRELMNPDGFNIGMNLGKAAGAGVDQHLHMHIVPRWNGDTNFMPIIADTKVIPEGLTATYRQLASVFRQAVP